MSLRASANYSLLSIYNIGREAAIPPMVFPNISTDPSQNFSFCVWFRANSKIPAPLVTYNGVAGSFMRISSDGFKWNMDGRHVAVGLPILPLDNIVMGRWTLVCVSKNGPTITIYLGVEDSLDLNPWERVVTIDQVVQTNYLINEVFSQITIVLSDSVDVCNFKFWKSVLTEDQLQTQANTWVPTGSPAPMWVSTLRTVGDISNIANPSSTVNWTAEHGFSAITSPQNIKTGGSLGAWNDPAYLAFTQPCPTWVYPFNFPNPSGIGDVFINPGMTPSVSAVVHKAPQFFQFVDSGTIPSQDSSIQSIVHYAAPLHDSTLGPIPSDSYALYKDENGVEVSPNLTDPTQRFEQDSGIIVPSAMTRTNMFKWQFGGQFRWQPTGAPVPSGTGRLVHQFLYITFIGFPTGLLVLSEADLSGLFILSTKLPRADIYHGTTTLKIPDPTVRTALIGE